jgi:hypothetical protein
MQEMQNLAEQGFDCWLTRVNRMQTLLKISTPGSSHRTGKIVTKNIRGRFDRYWLDKINEVKGTDGVNHNKLRTYKEFKGSFTIEPYIGLVRNRNQRCDLTRLRISAHNLDVERLRYSRPHVPLDDRRCRFCPTPGDGSTKPPVDDEIHAIMDCELMKVETIY